MASMWIAENALGLFKLNSMLDPIALVLPNAEGYEGA
jgi:hypothetical protein